MITGQGFADPALLHDNERDAIRQGRFEKRTPETGQLASRAIPGVTLQIEWLNNLLAS